VPFSPPWQGITSLLLTASAEATVVSARPPAAQSISHKVVPALATASINARTTMAPRIICLFYPLFLWRVIEHYEIPYIGEEHLLRTQFARVSCTGYNTRGAGLPGP